MENFSQIEPLVNINIISTAILNRFPSLQFSVESDSAKYNPVELKKPKEIASDSLQNPSDPDATYGGHKG